jgi:nicotinamidase-related amidase
MSRVLLLIDVQQAILTGTGVTAERQQIIDERLQQVVDCLQRFSAVAAKHTIPRILVQHDGPAGHRLATGSPGWQLREEIAPQPGEQVIHKTSCDSFWHTDLQACLRQQGATELIIGGCMTPYCVDTTVRRAVSLGFDVILLADGHTTCDVGELTFSQVIDHHNQLLNGFDAGEHQVRVLASEAVIF